MRLSVRSDYAARAVLALAKHYPRSRVRRAEQLAAEQQIPAKYLIQILAELKASQIVKSQRGKEGGYLLARPPAQITLADVLRSVHGEVFASPALADPHCPAELRKAWKVLQNKLEAAAEAINFQKLLDDSTGPAEMYYI